MWHEARKQERRIRGMLVDYKRRAERRREYYERTKTDPTQFLQIHGRTCKIHLDPAVYYAAEAPGSMMPWRGDGDSMIDRFDVRAHLDNILDITSSTPPQLSEEESWEERLVNYERYRILIQNEFCGVKEEKFLNQIRLEELYGPITNKAIEEEKKALAARKAAIGFTYAEEVESYASGGVGSAPTGIEAEEARKDDGSGDESDSDIDLDMTVDILSLTLLQQQELNACGMEYCLQKDDFMSLITRDLEEAEALRVAKEHEDEKAMYSGRKSRKERRALKKKHLDRKLSPPSYAARASPTYAPYRRSSSLSRSRSRSATPPAAGQIKFITSFGGDSDAGGSDANDGVTGVIILPKKADHSSSVRDRRRNRWDQTGARSGSSSSAVAMGSSRRAASSGSHMTKKRHPTSSASRSSRSSSRSRSSTSRHHQRSRRSSSYSKVMRHRDGLHHWSNSRSHSRSRSPRSRSKERHYNSRQRMREPPKLLHHHSKSPESSKSRSPTPSKKPTSQTEVQSVSELPQRVGLGSPSPPPKLPSPPRRRYYGQRGGESEEEGDSGLDEEDKTAYIESTGVLATPPSQMGGALPGNVGKAATSSSSL